MPAELYSEVTLKILAKEISKNGINVEQQGFRQNRSTIDAIFTLQVTEKALEYNKPAYLCFIDLVQAFDRVKVNDAINVLKQKKMLTQTH